MGFNLPFLMLFPPVNTQYFWTTASGSFDKCSENLISHPVFCISSKCGSSKEKLKFRACSWSVWLCMGKQGVGVWLSWQSCWPVPRGRNHPDSSRSGPRGKLVNHPVERRYDSWGGTGSLGPGEISTKRSQYGAEDVLKTACKGLISLSGTQEALNKY